MKVIIFAGGVGTRLWPLSRKKSPKQFEKIIEQKSTLQLTVERLFPHISWENIYISTGVNYINLVKKQLPNLPVKNIIGEPEIRDVGPAVGLITAILAKVSPTEPMAILWSDHLVKKEELFRQVLKKAENFIKKNPNKIIFIGQKPRFPSQNLGWIQFGEKFKTLNDISLYKFKSFKYRPTLKVAKEYFQSKNFAWNLGYFVTTPRFLWKQYQKFAPTIFTKLKTIQKAWKTKNYPRFLNKTYPTIEKIHFDNAILERLNPNDAYVISENLGWSDVGAWEALKEALQESVDQNITLGKVFLTDTRNCLVYNYTDQLMVTVDLKNYLVVNTHDVLLICHKDSVPKIKNIVKSFNGTEHEHLT